MPDMRAIAAQGKLLFSWGRYLYWAELKQRDWDRFMTEKGENATEALPEWLGVSCYWAASLYVVIEGWETAKFQDPVIEGLLKLSNYKDILRRLRNGTFHYQPELLAPKTHAFLSSPDGTLWLYFLHEEFCRWLRDCIETVERSARMPTEESQKWHDQWTALIGWFPLRPAEQQLNELRQMLDETKRELDASGDISEAAEQLRSSFGLHDTAVKQTAETVRESRRALLAKLGLRPDDFIP
jgi:hypothetical protein